MSLFIRPLGCRRSFASMKRSFAWMAVAAGLGVAPRVAAQGQLELTSGLGRKLYALPDDAAVTQAKQALAVDPRNVALQLKLSKAEAARRQYREAVAVDTAGLMVAPKDADLLLERGHRELGLREFEAARKDLAAAAQVSPAMLDAHYHLGLAYYFVGKFSDASTEFARARDLAKDAPQPEDSLIDCTAWLYVSLRRAGKESEAAEALARVTPEVKNTEPHLAFYLRLLHFYQGKLTVEEARAAKPSGPQDNEGELSYNTTSYGVGNWYLYQGKDAARARRLFGDVVQGEAWNSWGFVGSEAELGRMRK